jgi:hypothetical protein
MLAHLATGHPAPREYLELVLCRDVYHCTPLELAKIPVETVEAHLVCIAAENKVRSLKGR